MSWASKSAARPWWAASVLAATTMPEVSLSIRWTMPGRATPAMPERLSPQRRMRALTAARRARPPTPPLGDERLDAPPRHLRELGPDHLVHPADGLLGGERDDPQAV